jgi:hypothetical protein
MYTCTPEKRRSVRRLRLAERSYRRLGNRAGQRLPIPGSSPFFAGTKADRPEQPPMTSLVQPLTGRLLLSDRSRQPAAIG